MVPSAAAVDVAVGTTIEPVTLNEPVIVCISVTTLPNLVPVSETLNSETPPTPTVNAPVTAALPDILTEPVNW